jgi:hypothetical protein
LLHMLCVFLGASLFLLSVFFCFVCCNKWLDHTMFVLERDTLCFHCLELLSFCECSLFLVLRLAFIFRLRSCSELVYSL